MRGIVENIYANNESESIDIQSILDKELYTNDSNSIRYISANTDLNTCISPGKYICSSKVYSILNKPSSFNSEWFQLIVTTCNSRDGITHLLQTFIDKHGVLCREIKIDNDTSAMTFSEWSGAIGGGSSEGGGIISSDGDVLRIKYDQWISDLKSYGVNSTVYNDANKMELLKQDGQVYKDKVSNLFIKLNDLQVGSEIIIPHSLYGNMTFIAIGKNHDRNNSVTLLSKDIIRLMAFDAAESNNTDLNRRIYGNNRYSLSNELQWLNSDDKNWYCDMHSQDQSPLSDNVAYNPYNNIEGLLKGFDKSIVDSMITVSKKTLLNTDIDGGGYEDVKSKVFLLSSTEVGLEDIGEGNIYKYFESNNTIAYPSTYCLENTKEGTDDSYGNGKEYKWSLRTPVINTSTEVKYVYSNSLYDGHAYNGFIGIRFAFCLPTNLYLSAILVENPPTKTLYTNGESFNTDGLVVKAMYSDRSTGIIDNNLLEITPSILSLDDTLVNISYTEKGITKSTLQKIEVIDLGVNTHNANIGDEIVIPHSMYGNIPFIVIGKNHDATNSVTLLSKEILRLMAFDAAEPTSDDTNSQIYGYNRYRYCNELQWLNSTESAGSWFKAQHKFDEAPDADKVTYNPYSDIDGFLKGFSDGVLDQMIEVPKTTALSQYDGSGSEEVSSKVFLLSSTEVGLENENSIEEGEVYEYFDDGDTNKLLAYPSQYCIDNCINTIPSYKKDNPWIWGLRTPYSLSSYSNRIIDIIGELSYNNANEGIVGLRFAIVLKTA